MGRPPIPGGEWDKADLLAFEREMLGLYVSDHPLFGLERVLSKAKCEQMIPGIESESVLKSILHFLPEKAVAHGKRLDLGTHEATERVLRSAHDRLPAHIEAGVDDHRTAGELLEPADERMVAGVRFTVHGLDARGIWLSQSARVSRHHRHEFLRS